ncbi:Diguanylate cyclase DosC [Marinomonas spartinae]|uniref:Diguanylate cyclase DosC n=1 Tax=Marinomonas spartinae TaxID=1792290 RepID=A0A1A8TSL1_9GAMM|nr:sensor domain-containing diguanylate cyclase [Marinomonas spartinae]SBS36604.1 Diguanylate cyclase DosC [Marinomonas spartinae]
MSAVNNPFELAFINMPTPAFIIESKTGKLNAVNHSFAMLFENFNAAPGDSWVELSEEAKSVEDWLNLCQQIQNGDIDRCESLLNIGTKQINTQLEFHYMGEYVLACVYDTDHMDLADAENTLLKFALTESSAGLWIWETDSDLISCSASIALLLGCSREQTPKSTREWHQMVHPDDVERLNNTVTEHVIHHQNYYECEYRIRKADGEYIWVKERGRTYTKRPDSSIKKIIGFVEDISPQKALEAHLRTQATFDELTGLLNRGAAKTHFRKQLGLAKRQYTPLTMAKIHLDAHNRLADLPMEIRNLRIQTLARHIYKKIREADVLARVEPDKLLLLLPNTSVKDAMQLLNHIIHPTDKEKALLLEGKADPLDYCFGIAAFPEDGEDIEELAQSANDALEASRLEHIKASGQAQ